MYTTSHTDSFKALARIYSLTVRDIRAIADDLGLPYRYSADRRTWYLDTDATTVRRFNEHLAELNEG